MKVSPNKLVIHIYYDSLRKCHRVICVDGTTVGRGITDNSRIIEVKLFRSLWSTPPSPLIWPSQGRVRNLLNGLIPSRKFCSVWDSALKGIWAKWVNSWSLNLLISCGWLDFVEVVTRPVHLMGLDPRVKSFWRELNGASRTSLIYSILPVGLSRPNIRAYWRPQSSSDYVSIRGEGRFRRAVISFSWQTGAPEDQLVFIIDFPLRQIQLVSATDPQFPLVSLCQAKVWSEAHKLTNLSR